MKRRLLALVIALAVTSGLILVAGPTAAEQKVIKWRMVTTWPKGLTYLIGPDKRFCDLIRKSSNGQLDIKLYGAGELCAASEVLDMVKSGSVEAGGDWASYWSGKNTAFDLLGSHSMGFCAEDYLVWIYQGGGLDIYQEMYGRYDCVYFPHTMSQMESGIRTNKPIRSLRDLKGMKIRMAGLLPGKILQAFGGTPVSLSVAELYEALRRGTIDGCEYSCPTNDKEFHIEEITKYWLTPGWHQTSSVYGVMVNKNAFNSLSDNLKAIVESVAKDCMVWGTTRYAYNDALATQYFQNSGITITRLTEAELDEIELVRNKLQEKLAAENPDYRKILKSQMDFLKMYAPYREAAGAFGFGRNPKAYPKIE